jgi:hypothetical protein
MARVFEEIPVEKSRYLSKTKLQCRMECGGPYFSMLRKYAQADPALENSIRDKAVGNPICRHPFFNRTSTENIVEVDFFFGLATHFRKRVVCQIIVLL